MNQPDPKVERLSEMAVAKCPPNCCTLPDGLPEGSVVKTLLLVESKYTVEFQGMKFRVPRTCIHFAR
jgi:hypothetical protein